MIRNYQVLSPDGTVTAIAARNPHAAVVVAAAGRGLVCYPRSKDHRLLRWSVRPLGFAAPEWLFVLRGAGGE